MILTDTNILLRNLAPAHPQFVVTSHALRTLRVRGETLCIAPQNLVELWAVATRPLNENGLGLGTATALLEIESARKLFHLLPYSLAVVDRWQALIAEQGIIGKQTHDAHIVAIIPSRRY